MSILFSQSNELFDANFWKKWREEFLEKEFIAAGGDYNQWSKEKKIKVVNYFNSLFPNKEESLNSILDRIEKLKIRKNLDLLFLQFLEDKLYFFNEYRKDFDSLKNEIGSFFSKFDEEYKEYILNKNVDHSLHLLEDKYYEEYRKKISPRRWERDKNKTLNGFIEEILPTITYNTTRPSLIERIFQKQSKISRINILDYDEMMNNNPFEKGSLFYYIHHKVSLFSFNVDEILTNWIIDYVADHCGKIKWFLNGKIIPINILDIICTDDQAYYKYKVIILSNDGSTYTATGDFLESIFRLQIAPKEKLAKESKTSKFEELKKATEIVFKNKIVSLIGYSPSKELFTEELETVSSTALSQIASKV